MAGKGDGYVYGQCEWWWRCTKVLLTLTWMLLVIKWINEVLHTWNWPPTVFFEVDVSSLNSSLMNCEELPCSNVTKSSYIVSLFLLRNPLVSYVTCGCTRMNDSVGWRWPMWMECESCDVWSGESEYLSSIVDDSESSLGKFDYFVVLGVFKPGVHFLCECDVTGVGELAFFIQQWQHSNRTLPSKTRVGVKKCSVSFMLSWINEDGVGVCLCIVWATFSTRSKHSWLSVKLMLDHVISSLAYSSCSSLNMKLLKYCWSFSLA